MGTGSITALDEVKVLADGTGERWLTVPNAISLIRLLMVPVFIVVLLGRDDRTTAAVILAGLGATDWLDGWIARNFNQESTVGKFLDPTADRFLFIFGVGAILIDGSAPLLITLAVLVRELVMASAFLVLVLARGHRTVEVEWSGKTGAFFLMFALPLFVLGADDQYSMADGATTLGWIIATLGIFFAYFSFVPYLRAHQTANRP